jgi:hypothetical protein
VIRSVLMSEATATDYRYRSAKSAEPATPATPAAPELTPEQRIQQVLSDQARMVQGAKLVDFSFDPAAEPPKVVATYLTNEPFAEPLERGIANLISSQLGKEVALEIQYVGPLKPAPEAEKPPASPMPAKPKPNATQ